MPNPSDNTTLRRRIEPVTKDIPAPEAFDGYLRAWNVCVLVDRRGRMGDQQHLHQWVGRKFGAGWQDRPECALIRRAIKDYRHRRALAKGPLRMKSPARMKSTPVVGRGLEDAIRTLLTDRGYNPASVLQARLKRSGRGYVVSFMERVQKVDPFKRVKKLMGLKHKSSREEIGLAMTHAGLSVSVSNRRKAHNLKFYHFPTEVVVVPGFAQALYRRLISPRTNTVALDETMLPTLPSALRQASASLRRWFRSRKAAGAIDFGVVSPMGGEIQECLTYADSVGLRINTLRSLKRMLRHEAVLKCPHCGAPVLLKLNPTTLTPTGEPAPCTDCHTLVKAGQLLATRASASVLDDWTTWGIIPRRGLDRDAAPQETNTITTTPTNKNAARQCSRAGAQMVVKG